MYLLALCVFYLDITKSLAVSTLTATLQTDCACYGNDETIDSIMPNCSTSGGLISINSVYRGAKLSSTTCPNIATAADRDEANCCTYNAADDCKIPLSSDDAAVANVFTDCAGATSCSKRVTWQDTVSACTGSYLSQSNYMCMEYYCFPAADIVPFCDTSGTEFAGAQLYISNDNYPGTIQNTTSCCSCNVTASANSANVDVNIIDFRLFDETSTCTQALLIQDVANLTSYGCTTNNDFVTQLLTTSTTNELTVALQNNATTTNGYIFIGLVVSNGALAVNCGPASSCPNGSVTSTSTSGVSSSSSGSSSSSDDDTVLFGLSLMYSLLVIAGALLLLLVILVVIGCCVGYMLGKSKGYDLHDRSKDSREYRGITTPYPTTVTPKYRASITEGRGRDDNTNTKFVNSPGTYGRIFKLPRVEC